MIDDKEYDDKEYLVTDDISEKMLSLLADGSNKFSDGKDGLNPKQIATKSAAMLIAKFILSVTKDFIDEGGNGNEIHDFIKEIFNVAIDGASPDLINYKKIKLKDN